MATTTTTVSAWGKPGSWALEAEEHDAAAAAVAAAPPPPSADFPSLATAASTKISKKKKKLSLAEFTTGQSVTFGTGGKFRPSASSGSGDVIHGHNLDLVLPTGPRERTAEEMERAGGRGFGFYGGGGRRDGSDEPRRERDGMPPPPSRADEVDNWGVGKRSAAPMIERRERSTGGLFDSSQSRADESDSWTSNKTTSLASGRGRERRGGFEFGTGSGSGADSEAWGRRREVSSSNGGGGGGNGERPRLLLQPRTLPVENVNGGIKGEEVVVGKSRSSNPFGEARPREEVLKEKGLDGKKVDEKVEETENGNVVMVVKVRSSNPFGEARPREEVLKEKGQDWKKIDEKLEEMRIRPGSREGPGFGRRSGGFGMENNSWRKADAVSVSVPPTTSTESISEKAEEDTSEQSVA